MKKFLLWFFWDFSGLRFVWEKIRPPLENKPDGYKPPATIAVWLFGVFTIYVALFSLASERYENRINTIRTRAQLVFALLDSNREEVRKSALCEFAKLHNLDRPKKPELFKPESVFKSFYQSDPFTDLQELSKQTMELYKQNFEKSKLIGLDLSDVDFSLANFESSILSKSNFKNTNLQYSNLKYVTLKNAKMNGAHLMFADLTYADLRNVDFNNTKERETNLKEAVLHCADLRGAIGLTKEMICSVRTLYKAKMDEQIKNIVEQNCIILLRNPDELH